MKQLLRLLFLLISAFSFAQYTAIPDLNFEKSLISKGIDTGVPDGKVLTSSISNISTLDVNHLSDQYNKIINLTGIEDFTSLTTLICYYNDISNLDLSKNTLLTHLICYGNQFTTIDLSKNQNLMFLDCSYNKITHLDISKNYNLNTLFCSFNRLKTLNTLNNTDLILIDVGYNELTNFDVSKNIYLNRLICGYNKLTTLDVSKNINLLKLACSRNLLTDLDISKNVNLSYLYCNNNLLLNLNLKNGNNQILIYDNSNPLQPKSDFKDNPNLVCISVDDVAYSNANWLSLKDGTANYTNTESPAPIIVSPQSFCISNNQTLADLTIRSGTNLTWYNASTGNNTIPNNTVLIDGTTYYASQNSGSCQSARTPVKVFVGDTQAPFPNISSLPDITGDCHTIINTIPKATDACAGTIIATTNNPLSYAIPGTYTILWNYNDGNGNSVSQEQKVTISMQPLAVISSPQVFCMNQNKTLNDILITTGIDIKWYDALTNGNLLPKNTLLQNGRTYYASQTINGCESDRVMVKIVVEDNLKLTTLLTITGDCNTSITTIPTAMDACGGTIIATTNNPLSYTTPGTYVILWNYDDGNGNSVSQEQKVTISTQPLAVISSPQVFCMNQNKTLNDILITTGIDIKWYDALTNGNLLPKTTLLQNGRTYYASQTINGCESERTLVLITIKNTLAPTGDTNQSFCSVQKPTIANLNITGNLIKWYDSLNNGFLLTDVTSLVNGKTYYASQTINDCESTRLGVTVSIVNTPSAPTGNPNQSFCKKENATLSNIELFGQNIKWYETNKATVSLPNTTLLENNRTYYASQTVGCESDRTAVFVNVYDTALPIGNRNQQFCMDENATIADLNIIGTDLKWYDSAMNGNILIQTTLLQNGVYYVTQTLNNCESERLAINVKIQDTQIPIVDSPQTFCIQKNAKISDIVIVGENINWYESTSSSVKLSESTLLENGIVYYTSQTISNCESDRIPVSITILGATIGDCLNLVDELPYPKIFTPNNDGYNDYWTIDFAYLKKNTGIKIFDRYGKLLKTINSDTEDWNGTFNGSNLPAADYWFIITTAKGKEYKGHFSLKR